MYKFVVLCALFAAAAAKPGLLYSAPIAQYSTFVSPATTSISKHESSVIHPTPINAYAYSNVVAAPAFYSSSILPAAPLHFIKKRSLVPTTYYASQYYAAPSAPILATSYAAAAAPLISSAPLISHPLTYTHLIKKRSAPLLTSYIAPSSYSTQSRFDLTSTPISYTSPIAYSGSFAYPGAIGYSHLY